MRGNRAANSKAAVWVRRTIIVLCLAVFIFSTSMLTRDLYRAWKEKAANQKLQEQVQQHETAHSEGEAEKFGDTGILLRYEDLWKQNGDLAGWLSISGTQIDYPVMYTPDNPEYYLRRAFDGSYAVSGSLFIDGGCTPDSSHVIIYGHHMKNGTMFGSLSKYADEDYADEHPVVCFDTLYERGSYEVMAAFYSRAYTDRDQDVFRYYQYTDLSDSEIFDEYVRQVKEAALYDTGISAQYGDSLLTLSTCSRHVQDGRFVVVARRTH